MTDKLPDTIHRVFPDLARLEAAPTLDDVSPADRRLLVRTWIRSELEDAEIDDLLNDDFEDWQKWVRLFFATGRVDGVAAIRERILNRHHKQVDDAIHSQWEIARFERRYG